MAATISATRRAIARRSPDEQPSVSPRKMGTFATGLTIGKRAPNVAAAESSTCFTAATLTGRAPPVCGLGIASS